MRGYFAEASVICTYLYKFVSLSVVGSISVIVMPVLIVFIFTRYCSNHDEYNKEEEAAEYNTTRDTDDTPRAPISFILTVKACILIRPMLSLSSHALLRSVIFTHHFATSIVAAHDFHFTHFDT